MSCLCWNVIFGNCFMHPEQSLWACWKNEVNWCNCGFVFLVTLLHMICDMREYLHSLILVLVNILAQNTKILLSWGFIWEIILKKYDSIMKAYQADSLLNLFTNFSFSRLVTCGLAALLYTRQIWNLPVEACLELSLDSYQRGTFIHWDLILL